ncbi:chemotaxis protein [Clostridiaceae bacterium UIB06]|uniref:Chemotaxis protein n=1 Tax=Clostridium thailandense TaxID=2794346 RepID=A0A949WRQ4_9CLOT|nr:methyl-accepting chemotaxis protein [Clostridium thailandense]MBV7274295.1 chemotaxis protein [Clostridium thailandense]MCH5136195.1 chemotaxis protein [Clostridiaceae bacterium UIB06]
MDTITILKSQAELLKKLNPLDCAVMIVNIDGIILQYIKGEKFDLNTAINSKVSESGALVKCLRTGKKVTTNLPEELYGISIKVIAMPIFENNKLVGAVATCTTLKAQETLQNVSQNIAATSEEITATSEEVASSAISLSENLVNLKDKVQDVVNEIKGTDEILNFINSISSNTNLLGLNAAIEAARAGEHGRGFTVVANEIRKMADNSSNSIKDIKDILNRIQEKSSAILRVINETSILGEQQSISTKEIASAIQGLTSSAMNLEEISKII